MKKQSTTNSRNLGVIVLAGAICFLATSITLSLLPLTWSNAGFVLCGGLVALIALAVAISGRISSLKQFVKGLVGTFF